VLFPNTFFISLQIMFRVDSAALPLFPQQLPKEGDDSPASCAKLSDVSEDCSPSTAESDDQRGAMISDSDPADEWPLGLDADDSGPESGMETEIVRPLVSEIPPWRSNRLGSPGSRGHGEKHIDESDTDEAINTADGMCTDESCSSRSKSPSPLSQSDFDYKATVISLSQHLTGEIDASTEEPEEFPAEPEFAAVLRWDSERGAWVPDEIEIAEPPPLPPYATAPPWCLEGEHGEASSKAPSEKLHSGSLADKEWFKKMLGIGNSRNRGMASGKDLSRPVRHVWKKKAEQRADGPSNKAYWVAKEPRGSRTSGDDSWSRWWDKEEQWQDKEATTTQLRCSAAPFKPAIRHDRQSGAAHQRISHAGTSAMASAFTRSKERDGATGSSSMHLSSTQRTRLSSRAASFVPSSGWADSN
jgi:hypothetical protein